LELQGIPVLTPTEFINKVLGLANHPYPQEGYVHLSPTEQIQVLEKSMARAVERENYEEAAKIRDMIEKIKGSSPPNG
jgi:protein-arginine kinase activator protein McsA